MNSLSNHIEIAGLFAVPRRRVEAFPKFHDRNRWDKFHDDEGKTVSGEYPKDLGNMDIAVGVPLTLLTQPGEYEHLHVPLTLHLVITKLDEEQGIVRRVSNVWGIECLHPLNEFLFGNSLGELPRDRIWVRGGVRGRKYQAVVRFHDLPCEVQRKR